MKRNTCLLLFAALTATACQAQLSRYRLDFTVSRTNFVDSIAIEYDDNQVYLPVVIDGNTYRFLLDTGSGQAVVYDDTPFKGVEPAGHIIAHDAIGRQDTVRMVRLPAVTMGSTTFTGLRATLQRRAVRGRKFDGIIGFDLVCKGLQMKIDVRDKLLILTDRKKFFRDEAGYETKYSLHYHVPYIQVSPFGNYEERVLFDTGSRKVYAMNKQRFDEGEEACREEVCRQEEGRTQGRHAIGNYGSEPMGEVVYLALQQFRIGKLPFTDLHTLTTQGGSHIGGGMLRHAAVVFTPKGKRLKLQPYTTDRPIVVGNEQEPISFVMEKGQTIVGLVWPQGSAYKAGFRVGDRIVRKYGKDRYVIQDCQGREKEIRWQR